jgi:hypothetical protein
MAIGMIIENPDLNKEGFERVQAHLRETGPVPPEDARLVVGGATDTGWRMITVWDSEDALERFVGERLMPAYRQADVRSDRVKRTTFEVYALSAGDLTGVPLPA